MVVTWWFALVVVTADKGTAALTAQSWGRRMACLLTLTFPMLGAGTQASYMQLGETSHIDFDGQRLRAALSGFGYVRAWFELLGFCC